MTTAVDTSIFTKLEEEMAKPCDQDCDRQAEWAVWVSHSQGAGCPGEGYVCSPCKDTIESDLVHALKHPLICSGCMRPAPHGQVSDNLRCIPL